MTRWPTRSARRRIAPAPSAPVRPPSQMPDRAPSEVKVGDLLVATPALLDPNFERSVVLLLDTDEDGALGVVLNRPSTVPVGEILPDWGRLAQSPEVLFRGGPVATDSALAVGASTTYDT